MSTPKPVARPNTLTYKKPKNIIESEGTDIHREDVKPDEQVVMDHYGVASIEKKPKSKEYPEHLTQKPFRTHALFQLRDRLEAQQKRK